MSDQRLLIIIPCYKEAANLISTLPRICRYLTRHGINCDVLIVEGEKVDGTAAIVKQNQKQYKFLKLIQTHKGKGHQVKIGLEFGNYRQYLFMDADLATPLKYIPQFIVEAAKTDNLGLISGVRIRRQGNLLRKTVSTVLNILLRWGLGLKQTDTQCGFKLISRELRDIVVQKQLTQNWVFDVEYFMAAHQNDLTVINVPIPDWKNDYTSATLNTVPKFMKSSLSSGFELTAIICRAWSGWYKVN